MAQQQAVIRTRSPDDVHIDLDELPRHESDTMCRVILGAVKRFFEDPAVRAEYEESKQERSMNHEQDYD